MPFVLFFFFNFIFIFWFEFVIAYERRSLFALFHSLRRYHFSVQFTCTATESHFTVRSAWNVSSVCEWVCVWLLCSISILLDCIPFPEFETFSQELRRVVRDRRRRPFSSRRRCFFIHSVWPLCVDAAVSRATPMIAMMLTEWRWRRRWCKVVDDGLRWRWRFLCVLLPGRHSSDLPVVLYNNERSLNRLALDDDGMPAMMIHDKWWSTHTDRSVCCVFCWAC